MSVGQESGWVHSQGSECSVTMRGSDCQNRTVLGVSCSSGSRLRRAFWAVLWPSWPLWCCTWKLERAVQRDKGQLPHLSRAPISPTHSVLCTKNLYVDMTGRWEPSPCGLEVGCQTVSFMGPSLRFLLRPTSSPLLVLSPVSIVKRWARSLAVCLGCVVPLLCRGWA